MCTSHVFENYVPKSARRRDGTQDVSDNALPESHVCLLPFNFGENFRRCSSYFLAHRPQFYLRMALTVISKKMSFSLL